MNSIILIAVFVAVAAVSMSEGSHMERAYRRHPQLRKQMAEKQIRKQEVLPETQMRLKQLQAENQQQDNSYNYYDYYPNYEDPELLQPESCAALKTQLQGRNPLPSGYYFVVINGERKIVFCNFDELCGDDGGWLRVGHLDMTNPATECPDDLQLFNQDGIRSCGRSQAFCQSQILDTLGASYNKVCGRVTGFQRGSTDGFEIHSVNQRGNIETAYVDGVSITKGSNPREHIWTYVASLAETARWCPCDANSISSIPDFVGDDYFCEAAVEQHWDFHTLHTNDLLWDGQQCGTIQEACCAASRNNTWFEKVLSASSTDFLELRVCGDELINNENVGVNFYEIYIKLSIN